jgi:hypothetical protein
VEIRKRKWSSIFGIEQQLIIDSRSTGKKPKDPMGWLYEERFNVELRGRDEPIGTTAS